MVERVLCGSTELLGTNVGREQTYPRSGHPAVQQR